MNTKLPDQIELVLNDQVRQECGGYGDIRNCPIATAAKQQLLADDAQVSAISDEVLVGAVTINIYDKEYSICGGSGSPTFIRRWLRGESDETIVLKAVSA